MRAWLGRWGRPARREPIVASAAAEPGPRPRTHPGWFIALEGGDGVGKSTQVRALADWLRGRGFQVVTTREPGATELGLKVREIVLHATDHGATGARAEALLFAADRADHVEKVVRPALLTGAVVITDRYIDSSIAYQSGGRGLDSAQVAALSAFATDGLLPDLTVLLDIDPVLAWQRARPRAGDGTSGDGALGDGVPGHGASGERAPNGEGRAEPDKVESEPPAFHRAVREVFRARAAADPGGHFLVNAAEAPGVITAIIQDRLDALLPPSPKEAAAAAERHRILASAHSEEERHRQARLTAEQTQAEQRELALQAEQDAAARERDAHAARTAAAHEQRTAEELAAAEHARAEQSRRAAADDYARQLREAEESAQAEADAQRRRETEAAARRIEAEARAAAQDQAARFLAERAASEARTAKLVEDARKQRAEAQERGDGGSSGSPTAPAGPAAPTTLESAASTSSSTTAGAATTAGTVETTAGAVVASSTASAAGAPVTTSAVVSTRTLADDLLGGFSSAFPVGDSVSGSIGGRGYAARAIPPRSPKDRS